MRYNIYVFKNSCWSGFFFRPTKVRKYYNIFSGVKIRTVLWHKVRDITTMKIVSSLTNDTQLCIAIEQ